MEHGFKMSLLLPGHGSIEPGTSSVIPLSFADNQSSSTLGARNQVLHKDIIQTAKTAHATNATEQNVYYRRAVARLFSKDANSILYILYILMLAAII